MSGGGGSAGRIVAGLAVCAMSRLLADSAAAIAAVRADWLPFEEEPTAFCAVARSAGVTRLCDVGRSRSTVGGRGASGGAMMTGGIGGDPLPSQSLEQIGCSTETVLDARARCSV